MQKRLSLRIKMIIGGGRCCFKSNACCLDDCEPPWKGDQGEQWMEVAIAYHTISVLLNLSLCVFEGLLPKGVYAIPHRTYFWCVLMLSE